MNPLPQAINILDWTPEEKLFGYQHIDRIFPVSRAAAPAAAAPLPRGETLALPGLRAFMESNRTWGILAAHNGRIVLEEYREGFGPQNLWTSFSTAKSVVSLLVGCAVREGRIHSPDDPVARYLPEMRGGVYADVTLRHILTMTSGVAWNEDYLDPDSDVIKERDLVAGGPEAFFAFMSGRKRAAAPGTVFNYSTGETNLVGHLLRRVVGRKLCPYLEETLWHPLGMEREACWIVDNDGNEMGGHGFNACLRDYARLGLFVLNNGRIRGANGDRQLLPPDWMEAAVRPTPESQAAGTPYGYLWWIKGAGIFEARGIFGQLMHFDSRRNLLVILLSARDEPRSSEESEARCAAFLADLKRSL